MVYPQELYGYLKLHVTYWNYQRMATAECRLVTEAERDLAWDTAQATGGLSIQVLN